MKATNETAVGKKIQTGWLDGAVYPFVCKGISRRLYMSGGEWLREFEPDRGILLVSNHRSFFDQWPLMLSMWREKWVRQLRFPVRSHFFYDTPTGVAINYLMGAGTMYPPVFRDPAKQEFNKAALEAINEFLQTPGHIVGMHPEGKRNLGDDPYELLPAQPGVGQMALKAKPIIIPVFSNGLSNDIVETIRLSYRQDSRKLAPVIITIGEPLDYSEFTKKKPRAVLYKKCSDMIRETIMQLGEKEREVRARCLAGEISDDDPNWFYRRR